MPRAPPVTAAAALARKRSLIAAPLMVKSLGRLQRGRQSAIDGQDMAVDIGAGGRGQEDRGAADLDRLAPAAQRRALADPAAELDVVDQRLVHLGGEEAGRD